MPTMPTPLNKNLLAGVMFIAFGLFGLWLARDLDGGSAGDMGPGYFPRLVCTVLIALGGALASLGLMSGGEAPEGWAWRPLLLVTASALAFAVLLRPLGLVATLAVTIVLASAAGTLLRPLALALLVATLIAVNVGIFVIALKMPIPLWPPVL
jgi:hypothetical protein